MNDPNYRKEYRLTALGRSPQDETEAMVGRSAELIVSSSTFTRSEYDAMESYRRVFLVCENHGILRQVARFVRQEASILEIEFYASFADEVRAAPQKWPICAFTFEVLVELMVPPGSWALFLAEVRDYLVNRLHLAEDSALATVLRVQHALLPSRDRKFPDKIVLAHDFAAWHAAMMVAKRRGRVEEWPEEVPRLGSFGPGEFVVSDPQDVCGLGLGKRVLSSTKGSSGVSPATTGSDIDSDWELGSPVARPMRFGTVPRAPILAAPRRGFVSR